MICPNCKTRYADFPEEDWGLRDGGIYPKNIEAERKRLEVFHSDDQVLCNSCQEIQDEFLRHKILMDRIPVVTHYYNMQK